MTYVYLIFIIDLAFKLKIFGCYVVFVSLFSKYVFCLRHFINVLLLSVPFTFVGVFVLLMSFYQRAPSLTPPSSLLWHGRFRLVCCLSPSLDYQFHGSRLLICSLLLPQYLRHLIHNRSLMKFVISFVLLNLGLVHSFPSFMRCKVRLLLLLSRFSRVQLCASP